MREIRIFRYALPFVGPLLLKGQALETREGFLVRLADGSGRTGWGDCAPLPGFSRETAEEALGQLRAVRNHGDCEAGDLAPSVRFALDSALRGLADNVPAIELKVNALVTAEQEDWERVTQGFECVKLKVGGDHVAAAARVALLRETVGPDVAIRLDANRAWSDADALAFAGLVAPCGIEYIEEPLADPRGLASFAASAGIPVALDETLREVSRIGDDLWAAVGACVVKPTLHGAWALAGDLARKCREHDSKLVVSAAYESGVGMLGLARLISALGLEDVAHGLDTYRRLADDVLAVPLEVRQGRMTVPGLCEVRESVLEEVT